MNDFTKEELLIIHLDVNAAINKHSDILKPSVSHIALRDKIESMIDNYCAKEIIANNDNKSMLLLNQKSKICSHTKKLVCIAIDSQEICCLDCQQCKTLWSLDGENCSV